MLKLLLIFLFTFSNLVWAENEPDKLTIVSNGKIKEVLFKNLKKSTLKTINHHPNFKPHGIITYDGFLVKDILKQFSLKNDDAITIVGKTGQFSVEVQAFELLSGNNLIATHINGKPVNTKENGLQIIYDEETLGKYPHLKQRQFWCWWVRSFIVDEKFKPTLNLKTTTKTSLTTPLPWPVPYGISSKGESPTTRERNGLILPSFEKIRVELLNGSIQEIISDKNLKFFLSNPINNKSGAYSLHVLVEENSVVKTFISNLYYVKSIEVIK